MKLSKSEINVRRIVIFQNCDFTLQSYRNCYNYRTITMVQVGKYMFNDKFLASLTPFVGYGIYPNSAMPNFVKLNIQRLHPNFLAHS